MKGLLYVAIATLFSACTAPEPERTAPTAAKVQARPAEVAPQCMPSTERLCPSDEGDSDPEFAAFRRRMSDAVAKRDDAALLALVDEHVRVSFGERGGHDAFRQAWKLPAADSPLWAELEQILALGGSFTEEGPRTFWAPYVYAKWPKNIDAFEHVAAIRNDAALFRTPDAASPRVAAAPWAILRVVREPDEVPSGAWRRVRTLDGAEGWVRAAEVRSPIGYRAGFSKRSGEWKLEALVAGD